MTLECTSCQAKNSYRDQVVLQVMLHGMRDNVIRSKVMSRNTTGDLSGLHRTVDFIEAEEAGSQEASNLYEHSQINAIRRSAYQQLKNEDIKQRKCNYCGGPRHGETNSSADRQQHCRAWGNTCSKCQKKNHLAGVCRSKAKPKATAEQDSDSVSVDGIALSGRFSISSSGSGQPTQPPASALDLLPILANIRASSSTSRVNTIPLPHHVHSHVQGWLQTKPSDSPSHPVEITLDRRAYAQLSVPPPSLYHNRHRPGRLSNTGAVFDTGAQISVGPHSYSTIWE